MAQAKRRHFVREAGKYDADWLDGDMKVVDITDFSLPVDEVRERRHHPMSWDPAGIC